MTRRLLCIAHRGGPGTEHSPENSLEAIKKSLDLGVDAIEIDIWYVEGRLLVTHDRRLGRQIPGEGPLLDQPHSKLQNLRLKNGELVPTLHDVLHTVGERALLNIEIKGPACALPLAEAILDHCHDNGGQLEQYLVSSFDHQQLYQLMHRAPQLKRGVLVEGIPLDYARCCDALRAYSFNTSIDFLNQSLVDDAHARGLKSWVYTANHKDEWRALSAMGVDGAFTDFPAELMAFNAEQRS
ncbi:glycerophosphodiester phosphodiesterase [Marinimicrobium sp. ABcell2]|uniref:glycerophosphodiester phosphodiesterase n=1 Tax=Marinimicrobium sp. ABcell2 TaxID=3069751 RepID=UPI0027B09AB5|nr:glycerophosphodiester phosphodiesterase [Marinimicrobium sp. ABcell2]MDQ2077587.1 glycerophosphodiester phosphodiesterase [Marinimicrobium sp. ABcell2]